MASKPKVGSKMRSWYSDQPDEMSTVLAVFEYTGKYTQWFTWVVRLSAPRTRRGWMETVI